MRPTKEIKVKSFVPPLCTAGVWLVWALFLPMYSLWHYLLAAAISVLAYFLAARLCPGKSYTVETEEPAPNTGDRDVDAMIADGREKLKELRRLNEAIKDEAVSRRIDEMETVARRIFDFVAEDSSKLRQTRRFMSYYLPTAISLLASYDKLGSQGIEGKNISGSMRKIEDILDTIVTAFKKQLDSLFSDEALDISVDIKVLDGVLKSEGLKED